MILEMPTKHKHSNDPDACPSCEDKLKQAHPDIACWFREHVKPAHRDCHVAWSFRDKVNQNQCVAEGKSKLPWPKSAHNFCDEAGNPQSKALDLFKLASNGMACWEYKYFKTISDQVNTLNLEITWGGLWPKLGDYDHFELTQPSSPNHSCSV